MDKIMLRLTVVDDYPPVASEGGWAERQPDGLYRIANLPFTPRMPVTRTTSKSRCRPMA